MEFSLTAKKNVEVNYKTVIYAPDKESALRELEYKLESCPQEIDIDKVSSLTMDYDNGEWWELENNE